MLVGVQNSDNIILDGVVREVEFEGDIKPRKYFDLKCNIQINGKIKQVNTSFELYKNKDGNYWPDFKEYNVLVTTLMQLGYPIEFDLEKSIQHLMELHNIKN